MRESQHTQPAALPTLHRSPRPQRGCPLEGPRMQPATKAPQGGMPCSPRPHIHPCTSSCYRPCTSSRPWPGRGTQITTSPPMGGDRNCWIPLRRPASTSTREAAPPCPEHLKTAQPSQALHPPGNTQQAQYPGATSGIEHRTQEIPSTQKERPSGRPEGCCCTICTSVYWLDATHRCCNDPPPHSAWWYPEAPRNSAQALARRHCCTRRTR